jgi:hypothetical protein
MIIRKMFIELISKYARTLQAYIQTIVVDYLTNIKNSKT